jgi:hypothetical protein
VQRVDATPIVAGQLFACIVTMPTPPTARYAGDPIWVEATAGATLVRGAVFWYQDYDEQTLAPQGEPHWRVHFNLPRAGTWEIRVQTSPPLQVTVADGATRRGFVRTAGGGFVYDDGTPFIPIGLNLGWSTSPGVQVLADYRQWFDAFAANGGNACRIWMASWSFGIEWRDTPLGDYTARLRQAWLLDRVLALAAERGIVVMVTLLNHGAFSTSTNPEWDDNPYNQRNGGPLANPAKPQAAAIGVANERMHLVMAQVLGDRGVDGFVFRGDDGLDEITLATTTSILSIGDGTIESDRIGPADFGLSPAPISALVGGDANENSRITRAIFAGERGAPRDAVLLNAAAAIAAYEGDLKSDIHERLQTALIRATDAVDTGKASALLNQWATLTQNLASN